MQNVKIKRLLIFYEIYYNDLTCLENIKILFNNLTYGEK